MSLGCWRLACAMPHWHPPSVADGHRITPTIKPVKARSQLTVLPHFTSRDPDVISILSSLFSRIATARSKALPTTPSHVPFNDTVQYYCGTCNLEAVQVLSNHRSPAWRVGTSQCWQMPLITLSSRPALRLRMLTSAKITAASLCCKPCSSAGSASAASLVV